MQPELNIQRFLRTIPNGREELLSKYAINSKQHKDYPNLVLFKYNQIESPFSEPIVQEARGIILDESDNWNAVCYSFSKFFNYGESLAAKIDWLSAEVQEKVDGSLCQVYWYDNKWQVATSGTPDASGLVNDFGMSFAELFWKVVKDQNVQLDWLSRDYTWVFELTSPLNKVVVQHNSCKLWCLTSRHMPTLKEYRAISGFSHTYNLYVPERFPLYSIEDCIKAAEKLAPTEQEGFVAVDKNFNRIKIKSPAYVMLHHAKDILSKRIMCEIVRKGEAEEFKTAVETIPELKKLFNEICLAHETVVTTAKIYYDKARHIENQKEFALRIKDFDNGFFCPILFVMRKTGQTAAQVLASPKTTLDSYMRLIGIS
jgi:hypothetical protein